MCIALLKTSFSSKKSCRKFFTHSPQFTYCTFYTHFVDFFLIFATICAALWRHNSLHIMYHLYYHNLFFYFSFLLFIPLYFIVVVTYIFVLYRHGNYMLSWQLYIFATRNANLLKINVKFHWICSVSQLLTLSRRKGGVQYPKTIRLGSLYSQSLIKVAIN